MNKKELLGKEILDHLKLYEDLGVRLARKIEPKRKTESSDREKSGSQTPGHHKSVRKTAFKSMEYTSMFDQVHSNHESMEIIRADLGDCERCKLSQGRKNIVFGAGDPHAELMFVGEAPGADEDQQGLPFVGRAGQLLTKIINAMEMEREEVYICNILKCRPPENRNPAADEIESCEPFLFRQIESVRPTVICALGTFGAQTLLRTTESIGRLRGKLIDYRGAKLMATYHPAYLLRNPIEKRKVWQDMLIIMEFLQSLRNEKKS